MLCVSKRGPYNWLQRSLNSQRLAQPHQGLHRYSALRLYQNKETNWATCSPPPKIDNSSYLQIADSTKRSVEARRLLTGPRPWLVSKRLCDTLKTLETFHGAGRWKQNTQSSNDDLTTGPRAQCPSETGVLHSYSQKNNWSQECQ